jgi:hypothetical protein
MRCAQQPPGSIRNVGCHERLLEHRVQRRGDVRRRVCRKEEIRRCAGLKAGRNIRDVVVGVIVFVTGKRGIHRLDLLVGNVEHGNDNAAVLEVGAGTGIGVGDIIQHGGMVTAGPTAVGNAFCLVVLRAVGDQEDKSQRAGPRRPRAGSRWIHDGPAISIWQRVGKYS